MTLAPVPVTGLTARARQLLDMWRMGGELRDYVDSILNNPYPDSMLELIRQHPAAFKHWFNHTADTIGKTHSVRRTENGIRRRVKVKAHAIMVVDFAFALTQIEADHGRDVAELCAGEAMRYFDSGRENDSQPSKLLHRTYGQCLLARKRGKPVDERRAA